jgi:predicted nucleotidyltransferase
MVKTETQINKALREYVQLLTGIYNIFAVVLYGSYAQGKAKDTSDIDLAVFSDSFGNDPIGEMTRLFKLRRKIDPDIEPLPFSKKHFFEHGKAEFVEHILSTGKTIYREGKLYI